MEERETDVLVVGSGIGGCSTALAAAREGAEVMLATKATRSEDTTSYWAQGGVAVARGNPKEFVRDIIKASDGLADHEAVETLVSEADEVVREVFVETLEIEFDEGDDGFDYGREAAHGEPRILHIDASTGKHLLVPFLNHLDGLEEVSLLEDTAALELITHEGQVHGALLEYDGERAPCFAGTTVLATGGIGACYSRSTNPPSATGDGIAMAALAGADVRDMEYVQFHPTAFAGEEVRRASKRDGGAVERDGQGAFLLSEAVRGEGALLCNM